MLEKIYFVVGAVVTWIAMFFGAVFICASIGLYIDDHVATSFSEEMLEYAEDPRYCDFFQRVTEDDFISCGEYKEFQRIKGDFDEKDLLNKLKRVECNE